VHDDRRHGSALYRTSRLLCLGHER
jgi:hypothetical protein